jgi:hypothetical protein
MRFTKSKLTVTWLNVPLLLEFQIPLSDSKKDRISVSAGVIGGLRLGSHTKQMYEQEGTMYTNKNHDDFNLPTWRYGLTARIGYGGMNVFVNYDLSGLFKDGAGPELYPVSAGISFAGF